MLLNDDDSKKRSKDDSYFTQEQAPFDFETESRQSKTKKTKFAAE